jgi:hypothetical protein
MESDMAQDDRIQKGILGDIRPVRPNREPVGRSHEDEFDRRELENDEAMQGGSRHDETQHSGSRDVTEGVSGGLGTETGGARNYRQGTGASGGDIGNRPE